MVRFAGLAVLLVGALTVAGCGGSVKEIPPVKEDAKVQGDPKAKAMQGMPEAMRKQMENKK
jgi:hypothetical protein